MEYSSPSSSSWGCELKCLIQCWACRICWSSSSWGCELKYRTRHVFSRIGVSSSSWGCELKYTGGLAKVTLNRHPLREDVSWNSSYAPYCSVLLCHPLREDVSWNIHTMIPQVFLCPSSSSWGCELKWPVLSSACYFRIVILFVRMWVEIPVLRRVGYSGKVILFVRMWVEILQTPNWLYMVAPVILFVRMWVEICFHCVSPPFRPRHPLREDVSWNFHQTCINSFLHRHPLREDVSWNVSKLCQ